MSQKLVVFFSTFDTEKKATFFSKTLVQKKLVACVQILPPIKSIYIWNKKIQKTKEFLVLGKTTLPCFKKIKSNLKALHPYKVPELICLDIKDLNPSYKNWIITVLK